MKIIGEIRRCQIMDCLESEKQNLKINVIFNREPMKTLKDNSDMFFVKFFGEKGKFEIG